MTTHAPTPFSRTHPSKLTALMPLVSALLTLLIGGMFLAHTPPGHTPDIWAHVYRISALLNDSPTHHVDSQSFLHRGGDNVGGAVDQQWVAYSQQHYDQWDPNAVIPESITVQDERVADLPFNNAAINTPVAYAPQLAAFALGRATAMSANSTFYLAEIFTLILCALCMGLSIGALPQWRITLGFVLPLITFRSFSISADSYTQMIVGLLICMLFRTLRRRVSARYCWALTAVAILTAFGKFTYTPLTLLLLPLPWIQARLLDQPKQPRPSAKLIACVTGTLCSFAWLIFHVHANSWYTTTPSMVSYSAMSARKHELLTQPGAMIHALESIGYSIVHAQVNFNFTRHRILLIAYWLLLALVLAALIAVTCTRRRRPPTAELCFWWLGNAISVGIILLTYLALLLQYTTDGFVGVDGMQFRYFVPMTPLWLLCGLTCLQTFRTPRVAPLK